MSSHEKSDNKTRLLPSVSVLQEGAARPGRRLFGVNDFEAEARQLEWNLRDLHFLRQRPQGAKSGRLRHKLDLFFYDSIDVVPPQPLARAQGEKEQREDVCDRVHGFRKTDLLSPGLVSSNMMSRVGGAYDAEVNRRLKPLKGNHALYNEWQRCSMRAKCININYIIFKILSSELNMFATVFVFIWLPYMRSTVTLVISSV